MRIFRLTSNNKWPFLFVVGLLTGIATGEGSAQSKRDRDLRLVDSQGTPIVEATVLVYDGHFGKLIEPIDDGIWQVDGDTQLVVAKADRYQFSGVLVDSNLDHDLQIVMRSRHEPGRDYPTSPIPIKESLRAALRQTLLDRLEQRLKLVENSPTRMRILQVISRHDPERGTRLLQENDWGLSSRTEALIQREMMSRYAAFDPIRALEIVRNTDDDVMRASLLLTLLENLPVDSPLYPSCRTQALRQAEAIRQPQLRLAMMSQLAEHINRSGDRELARRIANANIAMAEELPADGWPAYSRSLFAVSIINDDPDRAVEMVAKAAQSQVPDKLEVQRAWARLAFACCHQHPKLAKQLLAKMREVDPENEQFGYTTRVIQWMAVTQPESAMEVAQDVEDPVSQAWLKGLIASRCHDAHPEMSRDILLRNARELFEYAEGLQATKARGRFHPAPIAVGLLPVCERVAPDQLESLIWQALWMSIPRSRFSVYPTSNSEALQHAAAGLRRYDHAMSDKLFEDRELILSRERDCDVGSCLALKPEHLSTFLDRVDRDRPGDLSLVIDTALRMLAGNELEFWEQVQHPGLWAGESDVFE